MKLLRYGFLGLMLVISPVWAKAKNHHTVEFCLKVLNNKTDFNAKGMLNARGGARFTHTVSSSHSCVKHTYSWIHPKSAQLVVINTSEEVAKFSFDPTCQQWSIDSNFARFGTRFIPLKGHHDKFLITLVGSGKPEPKVNPFQVHCEHQSW